MKDMAGIEIEVGDEIVYTSKPYNSPKLTLGMVVEVNERSAKIDRKLTGGWRGVKNGMAKKWVYDDKTNTGEYVDVPAVKTRIAYGDHCLITKKASAR